MNLDDIGYNHIIDKHIVDNSMDRSALGRVITVLRDMYIVKAESAELKTTITGNLQNSINEKSELPVVGDWVYFNKYDDKNAFITKVLPRINFIERRSIGKSSNRQVIAANIDYGFIVEAVTENFNINRIERYLAICNSANVKPIIVLTKLDLVTDYELYNTINMINARIEMVPIFAISNLTGKGINVLSSFLLKGKTYCLLGLSGVGKSTLLNILAEDIVMRTSAISEHTNKGTHTTTHREMFFLNNGIIIIDNPGMREVGITDSADGLKITFDKIYDLADKCRFTDCNHIHEKDCAVLNAVDDGQLDKETYNNYIKMKKEQIHFSSTLVEKRRKDKAFGKMIKNVLKNRKSEKH